MLRILLTLLLAAVASSAQAKPSAGTDVAIEASMLVSGSLIIERDGTVSSHEIDDADKVPDYVLAHIARAAPRWRFEPVAVDGKIVRAQARMTLRMLATPLGDGDLAVSLASATFGERYPTGSDYLSRLRMRPPEYPGLALQLGASGTAYLMLKIGRDGRVADAVVEQVNLRVTGDAATMDALRKRMAEASMKAARRWTFTPPTTGRQTGDPWWSVRVPVDFTMVGIDRREEDAYGRWVAYVPGPRQVVPWDTGEDSLGNDAIAAGSLQQSGTGYRLVTPLQPES